MIDKHRDSYTPRGELYDRIAKLQEHLRAAGIQAALIVQKTDLFYFSGTCQDAHLLVPAQGEPLLMARKSFARTLEESSLENINAVQSFKDIGKSIHTVLRGNGRIGLELDVLPVMQYLKYKEMLEPLVIVDVSEIIREIRMVKSPYELEYLKIAARLTTEVFHEIPNMIHEGMTELALSCRIDQFLRERGNQSFFRVRAFNQEPAMHVLSGWNAAYPSFFDGATGGSGLNPCYPQGAGLKKIGRNEPILIDFATVLNGYMVDHTRIFSIGPLPGKLAEAHNAALEIKRRLIKEATPGSDGKNLYDIALGMAQNAGFGEHFMGCENSVNFVGHGVGLELDELPVIAKNRHVNLKQGMILALEPKFVFPGEGTVGVEDTYIVTENGLEQFTALDDAIQIL